MAIVHYFESTSAAYDACQCGGEVRDGDMLVIASERVVGVAHTWPFAITAERGELHVPDARRIAESKGIDAECIAAARRYARALAALESIVGTAESIDYHCEHIRTRSQLSCSDGSALGDVLHLLYLAAGGEPVPEYLP